jgi:metal-responsive CopG/Arc/MetJ family transcriptional regulator
MSRVPTKLLLELPLELAERLQQVCDERGATKMGVIRVALDIYLRQIDSAESEQFIVKLEKSTAETFAAFREIRKYPDRVKLIESALLDHIKQECEQEKSLGLQIEKVKSVQSRKRIHEVKEARAKGE